MKCPSLLSLIMSEHIPMPGFPQLIVTRHFCYQWLLSLGWSDSERGYGSLDYTTFAPTTTLSPLTPDTERDYWLGQVAEDFRRDPPVVTRRYKDKVRARLGRAS